MSVHATRTVLALNPHLARRHELPIDLEAKAIAPRLVDGDPLRIRGLRRSKLTPGWTTTTDDGTPENLTVPAL